MKPFSKEILEKAHQLVMRSIELDYPYQEEIGILNRLDGYSTLCHLCEDTSTKGLESELRSSAKALNDAGIADESSAIKYINDIELNIQAWEPLKAELDQKIQKLKDEYKYRLGFVRVGAIKPLPFPCFSDGGG